MEIIKQKFIWEVCVIHRLSKLHSNSAIDTFWNPATVDGNIYHQGFTEKLMAGYNHERIAYVCPFFLEQNVCPFLIMYDALK